jgi:hypothetical protein
MENIMEDREHEAHSRAAGNEKDRVEVLEVRGLTVRPIHKDGERDRLTVARVRRDDLRKTVRETIARPYEENKLVEAVVRQCTALCILPGGASSTW